MRDGAFLTDGTKSIPLSQLRPEAWTPVDDLDLVAGGSTSTGALWKTVPVLYRAVDIRALAVSQMPFALMRGTQDIAQDEEQASLVEQIRAMLYLTEAALCLLGYAYFELATNRAGRNLTPFWLSPTSVQPYIDPALGLQYFNRYGPAYRRLEIEECLYVWRPNPLGEVGPGPAPAAATLTPAALLRNLDQFAAGFFARGAIKVTLLTVEGNPPKSEMEKLEAWWRRMVSGVRSAFQSIAIKSSIKPVIIGSGLEETTAPQLTSLKREDVAIGMGVPMSLLFSNALAGGTADAERLNFYDFVVVPECRSIIGPAFNAQYLDRLGLRLRFLPEKLEVYQASELQKAQAISQLVGQPILTIDEARDLLGRGPLPQAPAPASELPAEPVPAEGGSALLPGPLDSTALRALDLDRWQRKALKRFKAGKSASCSFESEAIDLDEAEIIEHALMHAQNAAAIKQAFNVPPPGADLSDEERALYERLRGILGDAGDEVARSIIAGQRPDMATINPRLQAALLSATQQQVMAQVEALSHTIGLDFEPAKLALDMMAWSVDYVTPLVGQMSDVTTQIVEHAVATYRATPGMTRDDLIALLRGAFGARRAETVAITSITSAASEAVNRYQRELASAGVMMERVWRTNNDERTCAVCSPRDGKAEGNGWDGAGPPAHPRCRCFLTLRMKK